MLARGKRNRNFSYRDNPPCLQGCIQRPLLPVHGMGKQLATVDILIYYKDIKRDMTLTIVNVVAHNSKKILCQTDIHIINEYPILYVYAQAANLSPAVWISIPSTVKHPLPVNSPVVALSTDSFVTGTFLAVGHAQRPGLPISGDHMSIVTDILHSETICAARKPPICEPGGRIAEWAMGYEMIPSGATKMNWPPGTAALKVSIPGSCGEEITYCKTGHICVDLRRCSVGAISSVIKPAEGTGS
jgi:hypothetical protein